MFIVDYSRQRARKHDSVSEQLPEFIPPSYTGLRQELVQGLRQRRLLQAALGKKKPSVADEAKVGPVDAIERGGQSPTDVHDHCPVMVPGVESLVG